MTPGTGKFFQDKRPSIPATSNDILETLRGELCDLHDDETCEVCGIFTSAIDKIERLQTERDCWKRVAELFGKAYTTDESGQFAISNGSDLFRAVMAYERALRDE